jgi:hypothetical protein
LAAVAHERVRQSNVLFAHASLNSRAADESPPRAGTAKGAGGCREQPTVTAQEG